MKKKQLIGMLVGALLLFIWQTLSWAMLNIHGAEMQYSPVQNEVLEALATSGLEEGQYFMPAADPSHSPEEQMKMMEEMMGKPWAQISYHEAYNVNMGMNMFRGFVVDLLVVFLLIWILMQMPNLDFKTALLSTLAVGVIGYLVIPYTNSIWFEGNTMGYIVDTVVQWGLVGAWLGWWLTKE